LLLSPLPGFDHRNGWAGVPLWLTIAAQALSLCGLVFTLWVMKANRYAARTIRVERDQKIISSSPCRFLRRPMYFGAPIMFLFTPWALGTHWTLPASALIVPILMLRLLSEEKKSSRAACRLHPILPANSLPADSLGVVNSREVFFRQSHWGAQQ
jgi:protein-S-isoprenylcysteine O-methyltransferase Ste14